MGNRGNIVFTDGVERHSPCIYVHWNGSAESVYPWLAELDRRGVRADQEYEAARFVQLVGEFFDSREKYNGLSLGMVNVPKMLLTKSTLGVIKTDSSDNGFFLVNRAERDDEGRPKVRRFVLDYSASDDVRFKTGYTPVFKEFTEAQVKTERRMAKAKVAYSKGIADFFEDHSDPRLLEGEVLLKGSTRFVVNLREVQHTSL